MSISATSDFTFVLETSSSSSTNISIEPPTLNFLMCEWATFFDSPEDVKSFCNQLRLQGYRKDIFNEHQKLHSAHVNKEFKNYDKRLKVERNWRGKELTR